MKILPMKYKKVLVFILLAVYLSSQSQVIKSPKATVYFLDNKKGNDGNNGLSASKAFKTLEKASKIKLKAGDQLLLKANQTFPGSLTINEAIGSAINPIIISVYGKGKATIESVDSFAILAKGSSFLHVKNLICKGSGRKEGNASNGVEFNNCVNIVADSIETQGYLNSGLQIVGGSNIRITNVYAHDNGYCGLHITSHESGKDQSSIKSIRNVYIGYCIAENNPGSPAKRDNHSGNGILVGGITNGLIEYCEAMNNGWDMPREGNGPVGIWAYSSDSVIIQKCYSHHNKTSPKGADGGGFDFDGGVTNSIMQYNLSSFNEGAGYGMFQYAEAKVWDNNILRYNISYHDGIKNGQSGIFMWCDPAAIPMKNLYAHNNTIINKFGHGVNFLPGHYANFVFENNIFLVTDSTEEFTGGKFTGASFDRNLYWNTYHDQNGIPQPKVRLDSTAIVANPLLSIPANDSLGSIKPEKINAMLFFKILNNSPARKTGKAIQGNTEIDYWGEKVAVTENPNIGADAN